MDTNNDTRNVNRQLHSALDGALRRLDALGESPTAWQSDAKLASIEVVAVRDGVIECGEVVHPE